MPSINNVIQRLIEKEAGGKADMINLSPNPNTLKCILEIKTNDYEVYWDLMLIHINEVDMKAKTWLVS